ncbi:HD-GYP domain-containing protein [Treponema sp.]|uniref:HD-GYP domain-containing protein n=1 Tax=Treponema sp. TaxID=166 RepID=UPI003F070132
MVKYKVSEIKPDTYFNSDVILDSQFLLTTPPCAITEEILSCLRKWNFLEVCSNDEKVLSKIEKANNPQKTEDKKILLEKTESVDLSEFTDEETGVPADQIPEKFKTSEDVDLSEFTSEAAPEPKKPQQNFHQPTPSFQAPEPLYQGLSSSISKEEDKRKILESQNAYDKFIEFINYIYTKYATQKIISLPELNGKVLELCNFVRENKKFLLRIAPSFEARNKNFLVNHSLRTAIFAIIIGLQIKMPYEKLIELGVASILHEIGQIRLPPQLYMNNSPLTNTEKAKMQTHTVIGCDIVRNAGLPLTIQLGVLDHHERENGSGYPRHLLKGNISLYGKIIGVACSFEAITAPRNFREARTSYDAMIEMLKNSNQLYDEVVIKALICSLSLYPIGAFVFLSNGRVGQVVDVSPASPKNPIVQIVGSINPDGTPKRIQTDNNTIKIVRAMDKEESADLLKSLGDTL